MPEIKDGAYMINLDEHKSIGTLVIAFYVNNNITYYGSFGVEHIPDEIRKFIGNKNVKTSIYRIQAYDSVNCGYFCIEFIDFMLKGKSLLDHTNVFSPNECKKNDNDIKIFSIEYK